MNQKEREIIKKLIDILNELLTPSLVKKATPKKVLKTHQVKKGDKQMTKDEVKKFNKTLPVPEETIEELEQKSKELDKEFANIKASDPEMSEIEEKIDSLNDKLMDDLKEEPKTLRLQYDHENGIKYVTDKKYKEYTKMNNKGFFEWLMTPFIAIWSFLFKKGKQ